MTKFGLSITFVTSLLMSVLALVFACKLDMSALTSSETEPQVMSPSLIQNTQHMCTRQMARNIRGLLVTAYTVDEALWFMFLHISIGVLECMS